ncbi:MAG: ATP-dependent zinc metalloprotease FtsH [Elusimicrobia bacterium]|nr:ATP-dependent zinc metalloprotease FtsH [Elusimicrobiota bacterium]MBK7544278.1 ATP-dependent zinc metalloprotease FtsH [Elusimicrobiota bacterium]MBK7573800.1 ATP-dependent zinc metalloprotease FtsH [Elusimicrobiota bacterium]MBK7689398.1 ATP-dependent zinc metalloprotease FtsH [Elusimicrobiota bacterium]MBK8125944.1 ATP-dependent zinc metalloprotease FtsH [Elusimicrobiota bacterium]
MKGNGRNAILWLLVFSGILFFIQSLRGPHFSEKEIDYSTFKRQLKAGRVTEVRVREGLLRGKYKEEGKTVAFRAIPLPDPKLVEELEAVGVEKFLGEPERGWINALLGNLVWIGVFIFFWWFVIIRQMQGGGKQAMAFGRSKAKLQTNRKNRVTFADVAGCDEAKEELQEIIEFLKDPAKFQKLGGKIPKGVLLFGSPGTGKTLLAKAVAGEAGVPFFSSSGSDFVEMFVGVGASRVRDLFEQGRKSAPCLLFVDEIDAVGRQRFAGIGGGHDEREQTLNQLLVEMDGFDTKEGVILIAATNRPDVLDPALLRPGRFDRQVAVPSPDLKGREQILKVHAKGVKLGTDVDLSVIARRTPGFVGADLANLVNEGALLAARRSKKAVEMKELEEAIDRVIAGPERKSRMMSEKEKLVIAYHESGHTLVAHTLAPHDPVHKVSIIPRGPALGYTLQLPTEDRYLTSRSDMLNRLCILLGGRTAEEIVFKEVTTGAQDDLSKATQIAHKMVCEFGMSEKLGLVTYKKKSEELFLGRELGEGRTYSDQTAQDIDEEVKRLIAESQQRVRIILNEGRTALEALAKSLMEKEVLNGDEIAALIAGGTLPAAPPTSAGDTPDAAGSAAGGLAPSPSPA